MLSRLFRVNTWLFFRSDGKVIILKEVDSDTETRHYIKNRVKYPKNKKRFNAKRDVSNIENTMEGGKDKVDKPRFPRRRTYKKPKAGDESNSPNELQVSVFHVYRVPIIVEFSIICYRIFINKRFCE